MGSRGRWRLPLVVAGGSLVGGCGRPLLASDTDVGGSSGDDTTDGQATAATGPIDPITGDDGDPSGPSSQPGPPQLVDATLVDGAHVELVFNEPIAMLGPVDAAKFRLSAAYAVPYAYQQATRYADPGVWNGVEQCHENCYDYDGDGEPECYPWCYTPVGPPIRALSVANGASPDRVVLEFDQTIGPGVCKALQQRLDQGSEAAAIFLHYSNNGPGIVDLDGDQLDAIAEHWTLLPNQQYSYQQGFFPAMNPFIPIPCPF